MPKLRKRNDSLNSAQTQIRKQHSRVSKNRLSQRRYRQESRVDTMQKVNGK